MSEGRRRPHVYRAVFREHNGNGPYICVFCGKETDVWPNVVVHHNDLDCTNDIPENLKPCHHRCHDIFHRSLETVSTETRAKRSKSLKAYLVAHPRGTISDRQKLIASMTHRGRSKSLETRAKMSEARRKYWERKRING